MMYISYTVQYRYLNILFVIISIAILIFFCSRAVLFVSLQKPNEYQSVKKQQLTY